MANKITELKSALGAGARPNKYRVNMSVPAAVQTTSDLSTADVLCKATTFPSVTLGQIEVFIQGRKLVLPGDTAYTNTWTVTLYQTEDHAIRKDMIQWMRQADHFQNNSHSGNPDAILGIRAMAEGWPIHDFRRARFIGRAISPIVVRLAALGTWLTPRKR